MDDFDTNDEREPGAISEHTLDNAHIEAIPAERVGGPPRRDDLTVTPSEMGRRVLEDATETPEPR
ncbi:MAG: hypothetical protein JJ863_14355 [Deltaproteobacteria bacterium]|nr:hypothetical protein [Deltaproteobacteria bacterium]